MKRSKVKTCKKTSAHSTFSMIKFYESIPSKRISLSPCGVIRRCYFLCSFFVLDYDEIGHLPEFDFTQRLHLLKKVHYDLSKSPVPKSGSAKRPKSRCKKKKCVRAKSATRKVCNATPSTCEVGFSARNFGRRIDFISFAIFFFFAEPQQSNDS